MRGDGNDGRKKVLARGTVRVDPKAALAKMRAYQLADPVAYVLEVVRAAVWAGAKEVHLENDSDDLVVWHDGPAPHADDLARILEHLFSVDDRRLRLLAVAVNTALGLGVRFLDLYTTHGAPEAKAHRVRWTPKPARAAADDDGSVAHATQSLVQRPVGMPAEGFRLHVREAFGVEVMREWFRGDPRETALLRRHVRRLPVPLWRDKANLVPDGATAALVRVPFRTADLQGEIALVPPESPAANTLDFYELGVLLESRPLTVGAPEIPLPLHMTVEARALPTNVSRSKVDTSGSLGLALTRTWNESLPALLDQALVQCQPDTPWTNPADPRGALHDALLAWLLSGDAPWPEHVAPKPAAPAEVELGQTPASIGQRLLDVALVPTASGAWDTPRAITRRTEAHLLWRGRDPIPADLTPWMEQVLWTQRRSRPLLALLDALKPRDADAALRAAQEARARYEKFRAHAPQPVSLGPSDDVYARVPLDDADALRRGVLVVPQRDGEGPAPLELRAFLEGRPFAYGEVDTAAYPLRAALEAPGVAPNPAFDGLARGQGLVEALRPVRRAFVDAAEALAALWSGQLPPDDPRRRWLTPLAARASEPNRRAIVRAAWVELSTLDADPAAQRKALTEGLAGHPNLAAFRAWHTTERGVFAALTQLVAQAEAPPRVVLFAGWTTQGARRDGRLVVKTQRLDESEALRRALAPEVRWVDASALVPTRVTEDLRLLLQADDPMRDETVSLPLERRGARVLAAPLDAERGYVRLAHHGALQGSFPRDSALGPVGLLLEDDSLVPMPASKRLQDHALGDDAKALLAEAESTLVETLALALQNDRVARSRLRGPLGRLEHPAVRRLLLTALGRLHTHGTQLAAEGVSPAQQLRLREILRQTPLVLWFGASGKTVRCSVAEVESELGPEGQRAVSFLDAVPTGIDPEDLRAVVLADRKHRAVVEAALQAKLVFAGDDLPRLQGVATRRRARATLTARPRVAFDDPSGLHGVGPTVLHTVEGVGRTLATLGREAGRARVEVVIDGAVALTLQPAVPDALPVALSMRVELWKAQALTDTLQALTREGEKLLRGLCMGAATKLLDALLAEPVAPSALEPARGLVLAWAEELSANNHGDSTRRKREVARLALWPTVGGALVSLDAVSAHTRRLPYAVFADTFEWLGPGPGEAPDPLVLRVRHEPEARVLAKLVKASADAQTAPLERLQRARRLRVHARDRIRLPGEAAVPALAGRLEDLAASLGVGELRLVPREGEARVTLFLDDGRVHETALPAPLGLDVALGSPEIDPASVTGSLNSLDLVTRLLDGLRLLLGRWLQQPSGSEAPWVTRAVRWYLLTTPGLDEAARARPVVRDSVGETLSLDDLDAQVRRFKTVAYVLRPTAEPVASSVPGRRVAVLSPPELRWLLSLRAGDDFTTRLDDDLAAQRWARAPAAAAVRLPDTATQRALARKTLDAPGGPEADIALLGWDAVSVGEIYWSVTRRPLGHSPLHTPWPAAVALDHPSLTPNGRRTGPVEDAAFQTALSTAKALVESTLHDALGPPEAHWAAVSVHSTQSPAHSAGTWSAVGWLWLLPRGRTGRVMARTAAGEHSVSVKLGPSDGAAFGSLRAEIPVAGRLWVKSRTGTPARDQAAAAQRLTEQLVRWAWPRLLEPLAKRDEAEAWRHLCLGALAGQLGHGTLRGWAKTVMPPGARVTLQRVQQSAAKAQPLVRGRDVTGRGEAWIELLEAAGMLVDPVAPAKPEAPKPEAPAPKPAPPKPEAPKPAPPKPEAPQAERPPVVRFPQGQAALTLLLELGLDRAALRAVEPDNAPCALSEPLVYYTAQHKTAWVHVAHPAVTKLLQGPARRAAAMLAVAVLGAVNRALEGVTDADEERILAALLERTR